MFNCAKHRKIKLKQLKAFTLAEVLVTLVVIGIVAGMTIPSLAKMQQEKSNRAAFKKIYSDLDQATRNVMLFYNSTEMTNLPICSTHSCLADAYRNNSNLKVLKNCSYIPDAQTSGCMPNEWYGLEGTVINNIASFTSGGIVTLFSNGALIITSGYYSQCDSTTFGIPVCGRIIIDVNGPKKPNKIGIDIYYTFITRNGLKPAGTTDNYATRSPCSTADDGDWPNGSACAADILAGRI